MEQSLLEYFEYCNSLGAVLLPPVSVLFSDLRYILIHDTAIYRYCEWVLWYNMQCLSLGKWFEKLYTPKCRDVTILIVLILCSTPACCSTFSGSW